MSSDDRSVYAGTDVLVNKHGVKDFAAARALEYKFTSARELELRQAPLKGGFDFARLQAIHKHVFQDMYEWAGKLRDIDMGKAHKETGHVSGFSPAVMIQYEADDLNKFIADKNQLKGMSRPEFVDALAQVHTMIDSAHPFREGNGRVSRIFLSELAKGAGYELDMEKIPRDKWTLASHLAIRRYDPNALDVKYTPDQTLKREIFDASVKPTMANAFANEAKEQAVKYHPKLQIVYDRLEAIQRIAEKMPNAEAGARLMGAEKARLGAKLQAGARPEDLANPYLHGRTGGKTLATVMSLAPPQLPANAAAASRSSSQGRRM